MLSGIAYIDIAVYVILFIFVISGFRKGFINGVLSLIGVVASLFLAVYFASSFAEVLQKPIGEPIDNAMHKALTSALTKGDPESIFALNIGDPTKIAELVNAALEGTGLPKILTDIIAPPIITAVEANTTALQSQSIIDVIAPVIGNVILLAISGILIFIVARIVFAIIEALINVVLKSSSIIRSTDRLVGSIFGFVKGAVIVLIAFTVITFVVSGTPPTEEGATPANGLKTKIRDNISQSSISLFIYENNPIPKLIAENVNIQEIIDKLISKIIPGGETEGETEGETGGETDDNTEEDGAGA